MQFFVYVVRFFLCMGGSFSGHIYMGFKKLTIFVYYGSNSDNFYKILAILDLILAFLYIVVKFWLFLYTRYKILAFYVLWILKMSFFMLPSWKCNYLSMGGLENAILLYVGVSKFFKYWIALTDFLYSFTYGHRARAKIEKMSSDQIKHK